MAGVVAVISFCPCTIFKQFRLESSAKSKHSEGFFLLHWKWVISSWAWSDGCGYSRPAKRWSISCTDWVKEKGKVIRAVTGSPAAVRWTRLTIHHRIFALDVVVRISIIIRKSLDDQLTASTDCSHQRWAQQQQRRRRRRRRRRRKSWERNSFGVSHRVCVCVWSTLTSWDEGASQDSLCDRHIYSVLDLHFVLLWQSYLLCVCLFFIFHLQRADKGEHKMELLNRHPGIFCFIWHLITTSGILAGGIALYTANMQIEFLLFLFWFTIHQTRHTHSKRYKWATFSPFFPFLQSRQRSVRTIGRSFVLMWWKESKFLAPFINSLGTQQGSFFVGQR